MIKKISAIGISIASLFVIAVPAFAHVIVYPHQVGIAAIQVFDVSVPTEKDNPTVGIKLLMPSGLQEVIPNAKVGWTINIKKNADNVTEIDWTGGSIPPEERDDFYFSAQVPPKDTTLKWKVYQTYQDGSVVAWDHNPTNNPDDDVAPPYSTTKVINDLTGADTNSGTTSQNNSAVMMGDSSQRAFLSIGLGVAIAISIVALIVALHKK